MHVRIDACHGRTEIHSASRGVTNTAAHAGRIISRHKRQTNGRKRRAKTMDYRHWDVWPIIITRQR